jgi:hypothetical protein
MILVIIIITGKLNSKKENLAYVKDFNYDSQRQTIQPILI